MKKVILLATSLMLVTGVVMADKGKKKKKCAKGKTCCTKSEAKTAGCSKDSKDAASAKACCKDKAKATTVSM